MLVQGPQQAEMLRATTITVQVGVACGGLG